MSVFGDIVDAIGAGVSSGAEAVAEFFGNAWDAITDAFSPAPAGPVAPCPAQQALSEAEAQAWFDKFRADSSIPWNYPNDCCYNRAHVMCQQLQAAGVPCGKAWNYAPASGPLRVPTANDPDGYVEWGYHVAPTVPVRGADGVVRDMVIDPSIASGPITPEQWRQMQSRPDSTLLQTGPEPYYRAPNGAVMPTPDDAKVQDVFDRHRRDRAANWAGRTP